MWFHGILFAICGRCLSNRCRIKSCFGLFYFLFEYMCRVRCVYLSSLRYVVVGRSEVVLSLDIFFYFCVYWVFSVCDMRGHVQVQS
jgi:hypothetical protein